MNEITSLNVVIEMIDQLTQNRTLDNQSRNPKDQIGPAYLKIYHAMTTLDAMNHDTLDAGVMIETIEMIKTIGTTATIMAIRVKRGNTTRTKTKIKIKIRKIWMQNGPIRPMRTVSMKG